MYDKKNELEARREIIRKAFAGFEERIGKKLSELKIKDDEKEMVNWFLDASRCPEDSLFWLGAYFIKDLYNL